MRIILPTSFFVLLALAPCGALADWKDMNADIDATNFIVHAGPVGEPSGLCTGTLISIQHRLVLTANHCLTENIAIEEKDETGANGVVEKVKREVYTDIQLEQKRYQGFKNVGSATYIARIVAHDKASDMGLLQLQADTIPQAVFSHVLGATGKVVRGDTVYAVGNPRGLDASVTKGIVSSTTRTLKVGNGEDANDRPFYQVDATVTFGNSGGALYNIDGELIGVPDATGGAGLGLVTPVDSIRKFLTANCYEDVWNDSTAVRTHAQCVADKLAVENERRAKAGLPPLEADPTSYDGGAAFAPARTLEDRPESPLMRFFGQ